MLTRLVIRNFKLFDKVEIELGERVVFVGPNNSGKTSALQGARPMEHRGPPLGGEARCRQRPEGTRRRDHQPP